jgi:hypothetical protein
LFVRGASVRSTPKILGATAFASWMTKRSSPDAELLPSIGRLGAGEGLLLDKLDPHWHRRYFAEKFYVDKYFNASNKGLKPERH